LHPNKCRDHLYVLWINNTPELSHAKSTEELKSYNEMSTGSSNDGDAFIQLSRWNGIRPLFRIYDDVNQYAIGERPASHKADYTACGRKAFAYVLWGPGGFQGASRYRTTFLLEGPLPILLGYRWNTWGPGQNRSKEGIKSHWPSAAWSK